MAELMDCMVNYFSFTTDRAGIPRQSCCYLVVAGPGPTDDAGVATITTLAAHQGDALCDACQHWFIAHRGGPEAALAQALRHLDAWHEGQRLHKVVSSLRRTPSQAPAWHNEDRRRMDTRLAR